MSLLASRSWSPNPKAVHFAKQKDKQITLEPKATELIQMQDAQTTGKSTFKEWLLNPILLVSVFISFMYACWKTFLYVMDCKNCKIGWLN